MGIDSRSSHRWGLARHDIFHRGADTVSSHDSNICGDRELSVSRRFDRFLSNITLTDDQKRNGAARREAVVRVLNEHYWRTSSAVANSVYVGSWAKFTRIRPPRDVDVLFNLPKSVYDRYQQRLGNKQSQLLQEVKSVIAAKFPSTAIRGDGPVVIVPFATYDVELIPAFALTGGGHWVCMTDGGGRYKTAQYAAEADAILNSNRDTNGNTRALVRMMKRWQSFCSVPLKSFHIELVAIDFLAQWGYRGRSSVYYDWMVRDFFAYLISRANSWVCAPGTFEAMNLGSVWKSKAETALTRAQKACKCETENDSAGAGDEWQKIFGPDIPKYL